MYDPGEFTLRAFLTENLICRREAVADLISSDNEASHQIAMQQMRGDSPMKRQIARSY
jgi:tRNA modification GTPase